KYYPVATPASIVPAQFTVAPVTLANAKAVIADIHAHSPDYRGKAVTEFEEVLQLDPENETAMRGLGYSYLQQHDYPRATQYLEKAAARDSKDPRVHFYYAMLLNQSGSADASKR